MVMKVVNFIGTHAEFIITIIGTIGVVFLMYR